MRFPLPLRALAHRNFRLYLLGQGVSIIGTWTQQVAMAWLAFQLTDSPLWLGLVLFAGQIPIFFLTPLAGSLIDCTDRKRLLYVTQTVAMTQAVVLAVLTLTGTVEVWHILALSLILGAANAFDMPTRQSFLSQLVGRGEDLANAIALNSSVFNGARFVGPALAGLLLGLTGPGVCFLVNVASYLAVLAALVAMRLPALARPSAGGRLLGGVREGIAYAWRNVPIRTLLVLIGLFNLAGMAEMTMLPIIAKAVFQNDDGSTLGLLSAAAGVGAFTAALFLAWRPNVHSLGRWITLTPVAYGLGMLVFSFAGGLWAAALLLSVTGFSLLLMTAGANTVLQTLTDEDKRGRVVSLYTTMVNGVAPFGGLAAGAVADYVGAPLTLRLVGLACVTGALVFATRFPRLWRTCAPAAPAFVPESIRERGVCPAGR
jgi:MFS family permease